MKRRGITLLELLVAAVMCAIVAVALAQAFRTAVDYEQNAPKARQAYQSTVSFEDKLTALIQQAYLSSSATDQTTYFIGTMAGQNPNGSPSTSASGNLGGGTAGQSNVNLNSGGSSDGIIITVSGQQLPIGFVESQASDLETLNQDFGPQGSVSEVALSMTPAGANPSGQNGLFIRRQTPSDSDYTQGGNESLLNADIKTIGFEFFDGTDWIGAWDSTQTNQHRLPAAVRVTYTTNSDPNANHVFVVRVPLSDVTPTNPLTNSGTTTTPSATGGGTSTTPATPGAPASLVPDILGVPLDAMSGQLPLFTNMQVVPENPTQDSSAAQVPAAKKENYPDEEWRAESIPPLPAVTKSASVVGAKPNASPPATAVLPAAKVLDSPAISGSTSFVLVSKSPVTSSNKGAASSQGVYIYDDPLGVRGSSSARLGGNK